MSNTPHINKWFEGFFKPAPEFNEDGIKRWISQKCIGYQLSADLQLSVFTGQAKIEDGTIKEVWFLQYPYGESVTPRRSPYIFEQPRVDIPQKEEHTFFADGQGPELLRGIITRREDDAVGEFWIAYLENAPEVSGGGETEREAFLNVKKKIEKLPPPDYEEIQSVYPEWKPGE